jgi:hypothetical protein
MAGFRAVRSSRLRAGAIALVVSAGVAAPALMSSTPAGAAAKPNPVGALVSQVEADVICDVGWIAWDVEASLGSFGPSPFCTPVPAQLAGYTL